MSASAPSDDPEVLLVEYATLIEHLQAAKVMDDAVFELLIKREAISRLLASSGPFSAPQLGRLTDLDARLRSLASRIITGASSEG